MTAKEIEDLERTIANLTMSVNSLTVQVASLIAERSADHIMVTAHEKILVGTLNDPGLIGVMREVRTETYKIRDAITKAAWIVATPLLLTSATVAVIALANYLK